MERCFMIIPLGMGTGELTLQALKSTAPFVPKILFGQCIKHNYSTKMRMMTSF